jgi:mRNA interferase MazF
VVAPTSLPGGASLSPTDQADAPLLRIRIEPRAGNGLERTSDLMLDKITTVPRANLGDRMGRLDDAEPVAPARGLAVFLGLA